MKNTKAKMMMLVLLALLLVGCNGTDQAQTTPSIPAGQPTLTASASQEAELDMDHSETEIGVVRQEYGDSDTLEVLMVTYDGSQPALQQYGGKHPEIEMLNNQINADALKIYQDYEQEALELDTPPNGIEILSYPLADEDFLQIITTCYVFPETRPDLYTRMWSYCYSLAEDRIITVEDMLADYELTVDDIGKAFAQLHEPTDGETVVDMNVSGFVINRVPAKPVTHFLLEVMLETESDPYMCFYMYTPDNEELEELDPSMLLDPDAYDLLAMDPPLRYGQADKDNSGNGTEGGDTPAYTGSSSYGGYRVGMDTSGFQTVKSGCAYRMDTLYASMHAYPSTHESYDAASMTARLKQLEDVTRVVNVTESEEHLQLLTYPTWLLVYETGQGEAKQHCVDVYFQTDSAEYRVHTSMPVAERTFYHDEVGRRLTTISLTADGSSGGVSDEDIPDVPSGEPTYSPTNEETAVPTDGSINGEDMAMDLMNASLPKGKVAEFSGDGEIDGEHVWLFDVGTEEDGVFTAEAQYAVTHDGKVLKL